MYIEPGELSVNISELEEIKDRHRAHLMSLPNVTGVGVGPKVVKGVTTREMAIKVYVRRKVPKEQLAEGECIPDGIDGIPTDVEEMAPMRAH